MSAEPRLCVQTENTSTPPTSVRWQKMLGLLSGTSRRPAPSPSTTAPILTVLRLVEELARLVNPMATELLLKTADMCTEHDECTYTCVNCGQSCTRKACETWHCNQCDDCIVRWGYDKALKDADKAITDGSSEHILKWHAQNVEAWKRTMEKRGL